MSSAPVLEMKSVADLVGEKLKFFIPDYQRGYRWTERQVKDLLDDIWEFIEKAESTEHVDTFYCLQPLVVKGVPKANAAQVIRDQAHYISDDVAFLNEIRNELAINEWEVIDGQQRLTTIYMLLNYLGVDHLYSLRYATRGESKDFLERISIRRFDEKEKNIDYFHMAQAYQTIRCWFENEEKTRSDVRESFKVALLERVNFIWYITVDEDPVFVFTRLNIGKIPLTNAELIKALLLNRSNFSGGDNPGIRLKQQEIALQWDEIEGTLQHDEFWFFLNQATNDKPTRIDMIFDLICERDQFKLFTLDYPDELKGKLNETCGTDCYRTFRYFYLFFKTTNQRDGSLETLKRCWDEIWSIFQTFEEWFNNLELYHYIGYLIAINQQTLLADILHDWNEKKSKNGFLVSLTEQITKTLSDCSNLGKEYETAGNPKAQCRPLLLLYNIQTVINQNKRAHDMDVYKPQTFYKFPFYLYKSEPWDVEHIDSNTENDLSDSESQEEYLLNIYLGVDLDQQKAIAEFFQLESAKAKERSDKFTAICSRVSSSLPDQKERLTPEEKNQVCNFALLDSSTNRSYGNSIFPAKRRIIIGKDKGKYLILPRIEKGKLVSTKFDKAGKPVYEVDAPSSFIPPCTKQVFLKYYSSVLSSFTAYSREDAKAYRYDIFETLKPFGVICPEEDKQ